MGVYCYADDLSLLSPTLTGIKEMLNICEMYAIDHDIIFNAKKSQLLCFSSTSNCAKGTINIKMQNSQPIPHVDSCMHLGNELCSNNRNVLIGNAVSDLNCRLNNLLADFSHCDSNTLSLLFQSYCMNIYGSQMWQFNTRFVNQFFTCWRKAIRRLWKIPFRTHNNLVHLINKSHSIDIILEKRCIKYIWKLINNEHDLYNTIVKYSLYNNSTTIGENIRYFMYKYKITVDEWDQPLKVLYDKIDKYICQFKKLDIECTAMAVRELCESRDSYDTQIFGRAELNTVIYTLCTS